MRDYRFDDSGNNAYDSEYSVPLRIYPPVVRPQRRRSGLRATLSLMLVGVLMFGSGVTGAAIMSHRMGHAITELEQQQARTNAEVREVATAVQGSVIVPAAEFNPGREIMGASELFLGANPAVVAISTQVQGQNVFGRPVSRPSAGSGFLVSPDGYIVTNHHVIENANTISVLLYDGNTYPATLVGSDAHSDLAVLKIQSSGLSYLGFADSDTMLVGEQVAAIGNPLGEFANSMTVGVVSALNREINIDGVPINMLQTDAAVNRGNSGGPLLDMTGRVVGVVTAKSGGSDVEGLGFAIPANTAQRVTQNLIDDGFVRGRAVMGVQIGTRELDGQPRVFVDNVVAGSGAQRAGVLPGDIITGLDGADVASFAELRSILDTFAPGDEIHMQARRGGDTITFYIILDEFRP